MWRAGPDAKPRGRRQSGFTLLEILVVVGLVAMLSLAVLVVPVWVDDQRQLDSESASLADTLTMLNEQSLFSGRLMALRVTERGWTPLTYDVGERAFVPAQGNGLQANRLPESLELTWQYDDLPDDEDEERVSLQDAAKQLVSDDPFGGNDQGLLGDDRDRDEPEDGRGPRAVAPGVLFPQRRDHADHLHGALPAGPGSASPAADERARQGTRPGPGRRRRGPDRAG